MTGRVFKRGDTVGLKASVRAIWTNPEDKPDNLTADVRAVYGQSGEVWLDQPLCGSVYWDQNDLVLIHAIEDKPR
jgi:hypothetical protein